MRKCIQDQTYTFDHTLFLHRSFIPDDDDDEMESLLRTMIKYFVIGTGRINREILARVHRPHVEFHLRLTRISRAYTSAFSILSVWSNENHSLLLWTVKLNQIWFHFKKFFKKCKIALHCKKHYIKIAYFVSFFEKRAHFFWLFLFVISSSFLLNVGSSKKRILKWEWRLFLLWFVRLHFLVSFWLLVIQVQVQK